MSPVRAGKSARPTSAPLSASNRPISTRVALLENSAKFTPRSVLVAPSGRGNPAWMSFTLGRLPLGPDEKHRPERRQIQRQGTGIALHTFVGCACLGLPVVARAAEPRCVRVEELAVISRLGDPDPVAVARHRGRIEHAGDGGAGVLTRP